MSTVRRIVRYRVEFLDTYLDFNLNLCALKHDCEIYLDHLMLPDDKYRDLIEGKGWDDLEVIKRLGEKLGKAGRDNFIQLFTRLHERINTLRKKLGLNEDFTVDFVVNDGTGNRIDEKLCAKFFTTRRCVKGGLWNGKYRELMGKIEADITKLRHSTLGSIDTELRHQQRHSSPVRASLYWLDLRPHALRLHDAIQRSWTQNCASAHTHQAQLLLETPTKETPERKIPQFCFSFALKGDSRGPDPLPWEWRDVTVLSMADSSLTPSYVTNITINLRK